MDETELAGKYTLRDSYRNQFVKGDELGIGGAEIFSARIVAIIDRDARRVVVNQGDQARSGAL